VRIRYGVYESNEELLAKILSGNSGWDVVFPTHSVLAPLRALNLIQPLDHARLPNLSNLTAAFRDPEWDRGLGYCVPYMWGSTGLLYRKEAGALTSWADLWGDRFRGRLCLLDDPAEVFAACLLKLERSINEEDPDALRAAQREAIALKPRVRAFLNAEVRDQVVSGDVEVAQLWATASQQAIDLSPGLAFCHPAEGFPLYADVAVVLRESRRAELAHAFLSYLLRPEVAAGVVLATRTATCNGAARALLPPPEQSLPSLYPPPGVLARGEWFRPLSSATQRLRDRLWTELKAA